MVDEIRRLPALLSVPLLHLWLFWGSVMVHAIFVVGFYGVPSLS
ncbi:MAG: hypothetical protein V3S61_03305 [Dehalococcoidales bacterium]